jgi:predicted DNA-binding transcriptional regulator AlpA
VNVPVNPLVNKSETLVRCPNGRKQLGDISRSKWYELVSAGELPKPIKLGRVSVWKQSDIDAFIARQIASTPKG